VKIIEDRLTLSATDLSAHLGCHHLTQQSLRSAVGAAIDALYGVKRLPS
jgi:hypothetical protein